MKMTSRGLSPIKPSWILRDLAGKNAQEFRGGGFYRQGVSRNKHSLSIFYLKSIQNIRAFTSGQIVHRSKQEISRPLQTFKSTITMSGRPPLPKRQHSYHFSVSADALGSSSGHEGGSDHHYHEPSIDSLTYVADESDAWRAHEATQQFLHRGKFWNKGKHETTQRYFLISAIGITQATVAYLTNLSSSYFIKVTSMTGLRRQVMEKTSSFLFLLFYSRNMVKFTTCSNTVMLHTLFFVSYLFKQPLPP
jgi:hypothetical protein